jgi:RNA polymerase sigma-70 factor (family 1)
LPHTDHHNEQELLVRIAAGDQKAFNTLYHLYSPAVFATALIYLKDMDKVKDIIQVVFIKIWEKRTTMAGIGRLEDWLFILVRNTVFDQLKKNAVEARHLLRMLGDPARSVNNAAVDNGDHLLLDREYSALLQKAIGKLPPQQRQVYLLAREQHLSYEEIAGKLALSKLTVKKHMELALRGIRKELNGQLLLTLALLVKHYI